MPPTTKITVKQEGEPAVTLHIDPAEPPVSLGDLLKRAKSRRDAWDGPTGGLVFVDSESDLEDVLDSYRLAGKMCGVQVFAVDHVVCWVGDIEDSMHPQPNFRIRMKPVVQLPIFYDTRGANALEDAAKWLREQLG